MDKTRIDLDIRVMSLSEKSKIAFAATCSEHLMPLYAKFSLEEHWGNVDVLLQALQRIWEYLMGRSTDSDIRESRVACEEAILDMDDFKTELASLALDVAIAVQMTIEACLQADPTAKIMEAKAMVDEAIFALSQSTFKRKRIVVADVPQFLAGLDDAVVRREAIFQDAVLSRLEGVGVIDSVLIESLRNLAGSHPVLPRWP
jgi:uncharacterized protein YjaG (DUF416 family)